MWYEDFDNDYNLAEQYKDNKKSVNAHCLAFIGMVELMYVTRSKIKR